MITIFDTIILFLISPAGFLLSTAVLVYFEYLVFKSIIKDAYGVNLDTVIGNYVRRYTSKSLPLDPFEQAALDIVARKENIGTREIAETIGIGIAPARKLMRSLTSKGYVSRKIDAHDKRAFCYVASHKPAQRLRKFSTQNH